MKLNPPMPLPALLLLLCMGTATIEAEPLLWNWSFAGETGQFLTDGAAPVPGSYTLLDTVTITPDADSVVPEPATILLLAAGLGVLTRVRR
jgi:hypothetical protein